MKRVALVGVVVVMLVALTGCDTILGGLDGIFGSDDDDDTYVPLPQADPDYWETFGSGDNDDTLANELTDGIWHDPSHTIHDNNDVDWFLIDWSSPEVGATGFMIEIRPVPNGQPVEDIDLHVYDAIDATESVGFGTSVMANSTEDFDSADPDASFAQDPPFPPLTAGTYYVAVAAYAGAGDYDIRWYEY